MTRSVGRQSTGKRMIIFLALASSLLALAASITFYSGYWNYFRYQEDRQNIRSLESDFSRLEVRLVTALRYYPLPTFQAELGRLRLQRAMAEIEFGQVERSELFLDRASEALQRAVAGNPADHTFLWELSKVYFLYNYPLLTYAEKGRLLCREALDRHPYNEFLFLNIALVFLEQWPLLEEAEKDWLRQNLSRIMAADPGFLDKLKRRWQQNYKETQSLESRLA
ncbi:MAG: hypothetical protein N3G18_00870, partial [Candidatus Saccharicenans sp.]|nr:hypothetical protein [Candidatus Saccharicenans sp.]